MREVARYSFSAPVPDEARLRDACAEIRKVVDHWLRSKGTIQDREHGREILFRDGRTATLSMTEISSSAGNMSTWNLDEPTQGGQFRTALAAASTRGRVAIDCELHAGAPANIVTPVTFEARCPQVLRDIITLDIAWAVRDTPVSACPLHFADDQGGARLSALITNQNRALPLIVISEMDGLILQPGLDEDMARDLAGLALVATASEQASWSVTRTLGAEWSCYSGAIRLYWPLVYGSDPMRHPLWTSRRLLHDASTEEAAGRLRDQFRRKVLGLSALTIRRHPLFDDIDRASREEAAAERRTTAASDAELLALYEEENCSLTEQIRQLREKQSSMEVTLANTRAALAYSRYEEDIPPDPDRPPATVEEAVQRATARCKDLLVFGDDVSTGVASLAPEAGPPDKVFSYLLGLSELAAARRKGPLHMTDLKWLQGKNLHASGESDSIRNNKAEVARRTWHDGRSRRCFDLHLKPNDGTSPDRCVRIYFLWDDSRRAIVVGWVGRKPGL